MDTKIEDAKKYVPHILDCAHAMNAGRFKDAWESYDKFKDCNNPLAKVVGARLLLHDDQIRKARKLLLDAISLVGEKDTSANRYIVEYSKVFLRDFESKEDLIFQIRKALSTRPSQAIFKCLPLFEDLDYGSI